MKKILQLALVIVTGLACCSVSAQESGNVFEKKKALELTAGYPSILYRSDIFGDEGYTDYFYPCVNISYVNSWRTRWELSTVANIHYSEYQDNQDQSGRQGRIGASVSLAFRYKWLLKENVEMYSALGLGFLVPYPLPFPYLAPVGIKFGKGKVYGLAELSTSPTSSFGIVGIGFRL